VIDQEHPRATLGEGESHRFTDLSLPSDTSEHDTASGELHAHLPRRFTTSNSAVRDYRARPVGTKYVMREGQMRKVLRLKRVSVVLAILLVGALALIGILSITRGTPVKAVVAIGDKEGPPTVTDSLFSRSMALYTGLHVTPGNAVQQLNNGDVYTQLWRDLRAAQHTITVQMYYSQPGAVADTMAVVLKERARAGVRVLLVLYAFGSQNLKK